MPEDEEQSHRGEAEVQIKIEGGKVPEIRDKQFVHLIDLLQYFRLRKNLEVAWRCFMKLKYLYSNLWLPYL